MKFSLLDSFMKGDFTIGLTAFAIFLLIKDWKASKWFNFITTLIVFVIILSMTKGTQALYDTVKWFLSLIGINLP
ncbi:hypothetical protein RyT2_23650 [Pseudolactococcus yaeyamensis]